MDQRKGKGGADYVDLDTGQLHEVKATSKANMTAKQRKTKPKLERMDLDKIPGTGAYVAAGVMAEHFQKQFKRNRRWYLSYEGGKIMRGWALADFLYEGCLDGGR